jgi:hypothetical protein
MIMDIVTCRGVCVTKMAASKTTNIEAVATQLCFANPKFLLDIFLTQLNK